MDVETLYRISGVRSEYRKAEWYTTVRIGREGENILTLRDPELRKERKKYITPGVGSIDFLPSLVISVWYSPNLPSIVTSTQAKGLRTSTRASTEPSPHFSI